MGGREGECVRPCIERVYAGLAGADGFALLDLAEAERVRALGWRGPILLLEGCFEPRDLEACSRLNLWHTVHHEAQIDWLAAHKTHAPHHVFLKMNSGMNRLGFRPDAYAHAWRRLSGLTQVENIALMTHFSDSDRSDSDRSDADRSESDRSIADSSDADSSGADRSESDRADAAVASPASPASIAAQLAVFERATRDLPGDRTLANSAATLRHAGASDAVRGDWVRPGIALYGASPDHPQHTAAHWQLRPTMSLRARVIALQQVVAGEHVGYGSGYTAARSLRVGVVACGYADGYPRVVAPGTPVLVGGVRVPIVGRVSMDMITVDLTDAPAAALGSVATLWGASPEGAVLPIDEIAQAAGTVGYELMCALAARVPTRADDA